MQTMGKVVNDPLFKSIVRNIVNEVLVQRGIPTVRGVPGSAQNDVLNLLGGVVTDPAFGQIVTGLLGGLLKL